MHLRSLLASPDADTAKTLLSNMLQQFADKAAKAMNSLEEGFEDATAVLVFPEKLRRRLRTTNGVERMNEEIRRRERVIRIFPNRAAAFRMIGAVLMELDEKWSTTRSYLDMTL